MRCVVPFVAFSLLVCSNVAAQHASHEPLIGGHVPREIIERPVPLRTGICTVTHLTSTQLPEAQAFYEQGLAYLHSYVWLETIFHVARAARDWDLARRASVLLIEHDKAYGGSQYAAALVADQDGKRTETKAALADAARLWKNADADYAPVLELRRR
jgi:hypothetical protein